MTSTQTLGDYFGTWQRNHEQSDTDLAAVLGVPIGRLRSLAAETVEVTEITPGSQAETERPIPIPPLPGELLAIADRHGVNLDRLVTVVNGRLGK
jgi:hypothetical protein